MEYRIDENSNDSQFERLSSRIAKLKRAYNFEFIKAKYQKH